MNERIGDGLQADTQPLVRRFGKILVANRGEIACRIMRTAKRLSIRTVAVYSTVDRHSLHVAEADEAILIGGAPARESYLSVERIIEAARATGAEAIHPGYGFLSENDGFADACATAGLVFIGPPGSAIRAMGSKSAAKALMERAGVPLVPGYHGNDQRPETLARAADEIGYPVLIKASAGGGGKGMRVVEVPEDLGSCIEEAKREAAAAFGDDQVLVERYLLRPRHIEVQVFGDTQGTIVSLHERECTLQRRHQKVVEEAPSPSVGPERRDALAAAARSAAGAIGYVGAGTIEFVADEHGFYFIEMNTRLQVEHPVTEMITGVDLVEWQLRVAAGEPVPLTQDRIECRGHAMEARIYAEDADRGFLPSVGAITHWRQPDPTGSVRVDTGFRAGDVVSPHYDPMLAKVVVWAEDREAALGRMSQALAEFEVAGVTTNLGFLEVLVGHPAVQANDIDTGFIERELGGLPAGQPVLEASGLAAAVAAVLLREETAARADPADTCSPWNVRSGWMPAGERRRTVVFRDAEGGTHAAAIRYTRDGMVLEASGRERRFAYEGRAGASIDVFLDDRKTSASGAWAGAELALKVPGRRLRLTYVDPFDTGQAAESGPGRLAAPMPGLVTRILAEPGVLLERNTPVLTLEAMKVVLTLRTPAKGRIVEIRCAVGDTVPEGVELAEFEPAED